MSNYANICFEKQAEPVIQETIELGKRILEQKLAVYQNRLKFFEKTKNMDTSTFLRLFDQAS